MPTLCWRCNADGATKRIAATGNETAKPYCDTCWTGVACVECGAFVHLADASSSLFCSPCKKRVGRSADMPVGLYWSKPGSRYSVQERGRHPWASPATQAHMP